MLRLILQLLILLLQAHSNPTFTDVASKPKKYSCVHNFFLKPAIYYCYRLKSNFNLDTDLNDLRIIYVGY